jgi:hypothetical protein
MMMVVPHCAALALLLSLAGPTFGDEVALGRDERRAERITGDDDPILIPGSAVAAFLRRDVLDSPASDPATTGSVEKPAPRSRSRCNMLAWLPDRPPDQGLRQAC